MNRRSFFKLGFGAAVASVARAVLPEFIVQKMDLREATRIYYDSRFLAAARAHMMMASFCKAKQMPNLTGKTITFYSYRLDASQIVTKPPESGGFDEKNIT